MRERWKGTRVIKGVLAADDAQCLAAISVDGVIVSDHGGRQLERSIRRGSDIAVALALRARMCFVGRAAAYGALGAQRALDILREELDLTLGRVGCPVAAQLRPRFLWQPPGRFVEDASG